jgi:hypothetical protein
MTKKIVLAGGCFWGLEDMIRKQPGVISTIVGYTGGNVENFTYERIGNFFFARYRTAGFRLRINPSSHQIGISRPREVVKNSKPSGPDSGGRGERGARIEA